MRKSVLIAIGVFALGGAVSPAAVSTAFAAETQWQKDHPRRAQVNSRLKNQVKQGDMTKAQAAKLHKDDRQIRKEERAMASQNGGHVTKAEQRSLNQQENAVSRQIGK